MKKAIVPLLLALALVVCANSIKLQNSMLAYATSSTSSNTNDTANNNENSNTPDQPDPPDPPDPVPEPVPPKLPTCSLKNSTLLTTESTNIVINNTDSNIKLEYALVDKGTTLKDNYWKDVPENNTIELFRPGSYDFYYRAVDKTTELKSETSIKYSLYYDVTAPRAPKISTYKDTRNQRMYIEFNTESDNGSAISNIYYRIDGKNWRSYSQNSVYIEYEGRYTVEAYCIDECGNESSISKQTIDFDYKDLMQLPTVKMLDTSPSSGSIRFKMNTAYTNMYDYQYKFVKKGSRAGNSDWKDCTSNTLMTIDTEGEWELYIQVIYDGSSINGSVATCAIDRTGPKILGTSESNSNTNYVSIIVDAKDDISRDLKYSFDTGKTWGSSYQKQYKLGDIIRVGDIQVKDSCNNVTYVDISGNIVQQTVDKNKKATLEYQTIYPLKTGISINNIAMTEGYVSGYGNNKFGPDDKVSRCQLAAIFNRVFDFNYTGYQGKTYSDVATTHWAYKNIQNIQMFSMLDTVGNKFDPNGVVTRAEMAHAICQFLNLTVVDTTNNIFNDIDNNRYKNDIIAVAKIGLVAGYGDNKFGPDDSLTRAQVVTIVNRMLGIHDSSINYSRDFDDVPRTHWAYYDIAKASR